MGKSLHPRMLWSMITNWSSFGKTAYYEAVNKVTLMCNVTEDALSVAQYFGIILSRDGGVFETLVRLHSEAKR